MDTFKGIERHQKVCQASICVPLDDEDERHQISKTLPTAQKIQGFSAFVKETTQTRAAKYGKHPADDSEVTRGLSMAKYWCAYFGEPNIVEWCINEKIMQNTVKILGQQDPQSKVLSKSNFRSMSTM